MNAKVKSIGGGFLGIVTIIAAIIVVALIIGGAGWVSSHLLPWFLRTSFYSMLVLFIVLLPLSAFRSTRSFVAIAIFCASCLFGATAWMEGFLVTLSTWGTIGVIIGLFFAGVGVVPVGMLAALFHKMWTPLFELLTLLVLTFGCRIYSAWLSNSADKLAEATAQNALYAEQASYREFERTLEEDV